MTVEVVLPADVHQIDETGFVWTLLSEALDPSLIVPGAVLVCGDAEDPFHARVVDIVESRSGHQVVHLDVMGVPPDL